MTENEKRTFVKLCSFLSEDREELRALLKENATPAVLGRLFFNRMAGNCLCDAEKERVAWQR